MSGSEMKGKAKDAPVLGDKSEEEKSSDSKIKSDSIADVAKNLY